MPEGCDNHINESLTLYLYVELYALGVWRSYLSHRGERSPLKRVSFLNFELKRLHLNWDASLGINQTER